MPRSRIHFAEPEKHKKGVSVDDSVVRWITLFVLIGLVAGINYVHPAFLYR
jgi:hypothetical protein